MDDPIKRFFDDLAAHGDEPALAKVSGSIRFDVVDNGRTEHWHLQCTKGTLSVSHKAGKADAVVRLDRSVMEGMVQGTTNAMAAFLRGVVSVEGDFGLMIVMDKIFPGPPDSTGRVAPLPARSA